jgi:hypothetical protein
MGDLLKPLFLSCQLTVVHDTNRGELAFYCQRSRDKRRSVPCLVSSHGSTNTSGQHFRSLSALFHSLICTTTITHLSDGANRKRNDRPHALSLLLANPPSYSA